LYSLNIPYGNGGELRELLRRINGRGLRAMADIVINHRIGSCQGIGGRYNRFDGMPMPWDEHAVTCDTGGLGNPKTGIIFEGAPNLDHTQEFVRNDLKNWMRWLRYDLGFSDFRFDFAKGYGPWFVRDYIDASQPYISIGEYWDSCKYSGFSLDYNQDAHRQRTVNWIDGCTGAACAFDFTTKAVLQEAVGRKEWWRLRDSQGRPPGVLGMWSSRAVTFVENHDTGSTQRFWPFPSDHVVQGYAYILTHPGQPCVFWDHVFDWGDQLRNEIIRLIAIRKRNDIHSRSKVQILEANNNVYAAMIDQKLCMKIGDGSWCPSWDDWELATSGESYAVWQKPKHLLPNKAHLPSHARGSELAHV
jgi:alpha-amylase